MVSLLTRDVPIALLVEYEVREYRSRIQIAQVAKVLTLNGCNAATILFRNACLEMIIVFQHNHLKRQRALM